MDLPFGTVLCVQTSAQRAGPLLTYGSLIPRLQPLPQAGIATAGAIPRTRDLPISGGLLTGTNQERAMMCATACAGYRYMGMQGTEQCFCGNTYGMLGSRDSDADIAAGISECDYDASVDHFPDVADQAGVGQQRAVWTNAVYEVTYLNAGGTQAAALGSVSNVVTHSTRCDGGAGYAPSYFRTGNPYYCDRSYVMTAVPDFLNGNVVIMTSNSDKRSDPTDTEWICFDIDQSQTVYVLYDSRATDGSEPGWLVAGFADQHVEVAEHTDTNMGFFEVWYAEMPAGTVCTGGNDAPGIGSHYILLSGQTGVHGPPETVGRACEGETLALTCDAGTTISVTSASYGRSHGAEVCPHSAVSNQACHATNSADIVMAACQDQLTCTVSVTNAVFGDPCGGTYKYLTVNYLCLLPSTVSVTNIATHSTRCDGGAGYAAVDLTVGQTMYCDRDYVFSSVPTFLAGSTLIRTSNSDKRSDPAGLQFVCFDVNCPATVYVLYDSRATDGQEPAWMQFMMVGQHSEVAEVTDAGMGTMEVWVYYAEAAGTVCLGGNNAPGIGSNYLVAIGEPMVHADADLLLSSVSGYTYIGCFIDSADRDLEVRGATLDAATSNRALQCANSCLGYMYMGMQWTNECFCDNDYGGLGARDSDATCDTDGVVGAFPDYADLSGTNGPTGTEGSGPGWTNAVYSVDYSTAGR